MDPAGVFATSFTQDQALVRTRRQAVTLVLFVLAMFSLPFVADARAVAVMTSMLITAVVVIGLQINTGLASEVGVLSNNTFLKPGMDTPFMVVFFNPPKNVKEFGVKVLDALDPAQ